MAVATIDVLESEPELGNGMPESRREQARQACVAALARIAKGSWDPRAVGADPGGFGLLIDSGFIVRRVGQGGRYGAELLGPGDLLRPWQTVGAEASLPFEPRWTAITPLSVAVLDADFARRAAPFPGIAVQLVDRTMLRSRHLAIALAVVHQPRVDRRLHMLLWHYADRWGRLGSDGVRVDVPLTHALLSELVAARRPTVSTALGQLEREGAVIREGDGWRLRGGPPSELAEIDATEP
jgi:CRP/FNR family transcriptional regulator, cyclic AMP receptor protein